MPHRLILWGCGLASIQSGVNVLLHLGEMIPNLTVANETVKARNECGTQEAYVSAALCNRFIYISETLKKKEKKSIDFTTMCWQPC